MWKTGSFFAIFWPGFLPFLTYFFAFLCLQSTIYVPKKWQCFTSIGILGYPKNASFLHAIFGVVYRRLFWKSTCRKLSIFYSEISAKVSHQKIIYFFLKILKNFLWCPTQTRIFDFKNAQNAENGQKWEILEPQTWKWHIFDILPTIKYHKCQKMMFFRVFFMFF